MVSLCFLVTFVFQDTGADNPKTSNTMVGSTGSARKHVNQSIASAYRKWTISVLWERSSLRGREVGGLPESTFYRRCEPLPIRVGMFRSRTTSSVMRAAA